MPINEPTLPTNESARSIIDSNLPRTKSSRELGRFCALFGPKESAVSSAGWDKGGDKFGRLTCHKPKPRLAAAFRARSSAGCRATENPAKNEVLRNSGTGPLLRTFSTQKRAVNGDKLGGMEFACFSGQKTESRAQRAFGARFRPKTSESGGSGSTFDAVLSAFCTKNGAVTKTGDIGKTFSWMENLAVLQGLWTKNPK